MTAILGDGHVSLIIEDFEDNAGHAIDIGNQRIVDAARRWATITHDGGLVFADAHDLAVGE